MEWSGGSEMPLDVKSGFTAEHEEPLNLLWSLFPEVCAFAGDKVAKNPTNRKELMKNAVENFMTTREDPVPN
jgi:hypothetical protein